MTYGFKMKLTTLPYHPLFTENNLGSETWWNLVQKIGTPLAIKKHEGWQCIFLWRIQHKTENIYIDVYSQTPSIYQKWNKFQHIKNTDIAFFEVTLPHDWSGSYVIVASPEIEPQTEKSLLRRGWWQDQLQSHAKVDPFNIHSAYPAQISCWVNQIYLGKQPPLELTHKSARFHTIEWDSSLLQTHYSIDLHGDYTSPNSPLIVFLDGQVWSRHLPLLLHLQHLTEQGKITPAFYAFVHSNNSRQRCLDYGCRDLFSQALVQELIPRVKEYFKLNDIRETILCGQSLGGLCALHSYLLYPDTFQALILQSGSYWWSDYSNSPFLKNSRKRFLDLVEQNLKPSHNNDQIFLSAGLYETDMREDAYQLYGNLEPFLNVNIHAFSGGHDAVNWQHDLISTLQNLLSL